LEPASYWDIETASSATEQSLEGVEQVAKIVLSMKEFSHPGSKYKESTDINRCLENALTVSRNEWKHVADLDLQLAPDLPNVLALQGELNQVFLNLIVNASHAIEAAKKDGKGRICITTRIIDDWVEISVSDDGTGMSKDIMEKIFDPFYTTKEVGKGTGQGLAIAQDIVVSKHDGKMKVASEPGQGTKFTILLPVTEREAT